jgi:p-hydroxybenzoate 3-monooxygenase
MDTLREAGVGERMDREGALHEGIELRYDGEGHRIDFTALAGRAIMVYGQQEVVKDLIAARREAGQPLHFEVEDVEVDPESTTIRYRRQGEDHVLNCKAIAGCDGFHGVCRTAVPAVLRREWEREYELGWLGILARVAPSSDELVYAHNERGFALLSLRSPELSRYYVQVDPDEDLSAWPDERIWDELERRTALDGWMLERGPIVEKGITGMRSYVCAPMQHERLYLAGDAAHIVPPTGAKGLNLAIHDVRVLGEALVRLFEHGDRSGLDGYTDACLRRVWRAEHFSWWMTTMLHRLPGADAFDEQLQLTQLRYTVTSTAAATALAENYTGIAD